MTPFPMRLKSNDPRIETINISNLKNPKIMAILTADRDFIKDGGSVQIMAEISGLETAENGYFTIQCGPAINDDDILDAVAPRCDLSTPFFLVYFLVLFLIFLIFLSRTYVFFKLYFKTKKD